MHKEVIKQEREMLTQELKDIDHIKGRDEQIYEEAEDILEEQDSAISRTSDAIHRLRNR